MNKLLIALALVATQASAGHWSLYTSKDCSWQTEQYRKTLVTETFLACIKNGNPMSDEEGEDLVVQCEYSVRNLVCPETAVLKYWNGQSWQFERLATPEEVKEFSKLEELEKAE